MWKVRIQGAENPFGEETLSLAMALRATQIRHAVPSRADNEAASGIFDGSSP
jgi:hypothetical protein